MPHMHKTKIKGKKQLPTATEIEWIKSLMPIDMYLYEYAKQLFEQRWHMYLYQHQIRDKIENLTKIVPRLPGFIDGCKSTRFILDCSTLNIHYNYTNFDYRRLYVVTKYDLSN